MTDDFVDGLFAEREARKASVNGNGRVPSSGTTRVLSDGSDGTPYGLKALEDQCHEMANTPEGERNHFLNVSAVKLGGLVAASELDEEVARERLADAAEVAGLEPAEIRATLNSGFAYGLTHPREIEHTEVPEGVELVWLGDERGPTAGHDAASVRERLKILDWHELYADEREEEWIVEPLLPARRIVALYSAAGVGKSILMLEIAVAVARGQSVLGASAGRPRRVLYVDFENDPRGDVRERLRNMDLEPEDLGNLCYLSFPVLAGLDSKDGGEELAAVMLAYDCEVVVIDTVSRAVRGEENENDTWLDFYRYTGIVIKRNGWACIRLDHSGKDETKGQRGGSAKTGDVDAVWRMTKSAEDTFRLICEKNRMPIHEKELTIKRLDEPQLHHKVEASAWRAARDAEEAEVITILDEANAPLDIGRDRAEAILRTSRRAQAPSHKRTSEILKRRRQQRMPYLSVPDVLGQADAQDSPRGARTGQDGND